MVSERYFLFGIEEMGEALKSIIPSVPSGLFNNIIQGLKSDKIPSDKILEFLSNFLNNGIIKILIEDPKIGAHIKNQFLNKSGKKLNLETDFLDPITIEIVNNSNLIKINKAEMGKNIPAIKINQSLINQILENNDFRFLKYLTLPQDDPLAIKFSETDREYIADMIVRIFLTFATAILMREDLQSKIKKNIEESIKMASSLFS
jgi:hypothetical protein